MEFPKGHWLLDQKINKLIFLNLGIAIAYIVIVNISLKFISLPGNIASVWLPAAMTLTLVISQGISVFPGIFLGSIFGISTALLELTPPLSIFNFIFLNVICAGLNCLQPFITHYLIQRFAKYQNIFNHVNGVFIFIIAAIFSPAVSATIGIGAHCLTGVINWNNYGISWITWWSASALGHLIFTPFLLLFNSFRKQKFQYRGIEKLFLITIFIFIVWLAFIKNYDLEYIFLPLLIWSVFRLGNLFSSLLVSLVAIVAIVATANGYGNFVKNTPHESLVILQSFIGVFSITSLILSAVVDEKRVAQSSLEKTLNTLELQVRERTAALQQSEAQLDGFFSSASIGMSIVDEQLRYMRINEVLAEINGTSVADHLGKTVQEILPNLYPAIEPFYKQVLLTGKPFLNQEITGEVPSQPGIKLTWLVSFFPIFNMDNIPCRVGVVVIDISDRKKIEIQLQKQARIDGLTQIANRRYFNEIFLIEWQRCIRNQQPLALILCDVDYFKPYNDTYGHPMGDECLIQIAKALSGNIQRSTDLVARYGGEEFVVLLTNTDREGALHIANMIRDQIHKLNIAHKNSLVSNHITASIGVCVSIPTIYHQPDQLLSTADQALYQAKQEGRDRIIIKMMDNESVLI
ncbi:diguanylate cyclase domain-containing protein [Anabaena sp. UHCC 0204]|uniref:diguanylate cyclase domain-containing protein n=1 Tax=Anabaena sp. UHCC 0204 TaxID=2590009 RepID=UPI001444F8AD|nr:diguanylate cyclase [Anabaena sp. UHCC 0204]MTJ07268.1 diguanylate cyclase [Anabaena sp. UHCC 0204]